MISFASAINDTDKKCSPFYKAFSFHRHMAVYFLIIAFVSAVFSVRSVDLVWENTFDCQLFVICDYINQKTKLANFP